HPAGAQDDVGMAGGDRVERARVDPDAQLVGHREASPLSPAWLAPLPAPFDAPFVAPWPLPLVPGAPSVSAIRVTETTRSPSSTRSRVTPWVLRPAMRTSRTWVRMSWPPSVISMISSLAATGNDATTLPFRAVTSMLAMPEPPRPVARYS